MLRNVWVFLLIGLFSGSVQANDFERFPNMMKFIRSVPMFKPEPRPAGNEHLIHSPMVYHPPKELWNGFFKAAVADKLTNLRALGLIAREMKSRGVTIHGPGSDFEDAVRDNNIDLGLSIPVRGIGYAVWEPDSTVEDPEFLLHLSVVYTEKFIHQFPDEVLPANLKIGFDDETDYYLDGQKRHGYLLTADLYYGPNGIGFRNVHGIGGQKRGFAGFVQRMLFFLSDAVGSMVIHEESNTMVTEALINTTVENFETREVYRIRYRN